MTYKYKTISSAGGRLTAQHPTAPVGIAPDGRVATYEVTGVPAEASMAQVLALLDVTILLGRRYSVPYSAMGAGRIVS